MKLLSLPLAVVCLAGWVATASAADQTEYIKGPPKVLENADAFVDAAGAAMTHAQAKSLITAALPGAAVDDTDFYCLIHIVRWKDKAGEVDQSRWYVYRARGSAATSGGRWTPDRFAGTRIYGSHDVAVVYVHTNVPMASVETARGEILRAARAVPAASLKNKAGSAATAEQVLEEYLPADATAAVDVVSKRGVALARAGGFLVEPDYLGVSYQVDVVKKLPSPVQNLSDALAIGGLEAAAAVNEVTTKPGVLYGGRILEIADVPSDVKVQGRLVVKKPAASDTTFDLGSKTYDNEGLYFWDVSLGVPLNTIKQLNFEAEGGAIVPKEVDKQNLYLLFNIFIRPTDTKKLEHRLIPSPLIGIGLSKKPLDTVFAGLSMGLNRIQIFGGGVWLKTQETAGVAATYQQKWLVGANVPVRQIANLLKAKK